MRLCRLVGPQELEALAQAARCSPRGRANLNLHPTLSDPIQRFFNLLNPGTYVRPHRHREGRFELFLLLCGRAGVLVFDGEGNLAEAVCLAPGGARAVEIPGGLMHTVIALESPTLLFEVKPGPYQPLEDKDFAPWAAREGEAAARELLAQWEKVFSPGGTHLNGPKGCT